jgi:hypothetical protein
VRMCQCVAPCKCRHYHSPTLRSARHTCDSVFLKNACVSACRAAHRRVTVMTRDTRTRTAQSRVHVIVDEAGEQRLEVARRGRVATHVLRTRLRACAHASHTRTRNVSTFSTSRHSSLPRTSRFNVCSGVNNCLTSELRTRAITSYVHTHTRAHDALCTCRHVARYRSEHTLDHAQMLVIAFRLHVVSARHAITTVTASPGTTSRP